MRVDSPGPDRSSQRHARLETILLVEDQEEVRNLIRRMLAARGYHVLARERHDALA